LIRGRGSQHIESQKTNYIDHSSIPSTSIVYRNHHSTESAPNKPLIPQFLNHTKPSLQPHSANIGGTPALAIRKKNPSKSQSDGISRTNDCEERSQQDLARTSLLQPVGPKTYKHRHSSDQNPSENLKLKTTGKCTDQPPRNRRSRAVLKRNNNKKNTHTKKSRKKIPKGKQQQGGGSGAARDQKQGEGIELPRARESMLPPSSDFDFQPGFLRGHWGLCFAPGESDSTNRWRAVCACAACGAQ